MKKIIFGAIYFVSSLALANELQGTWHKEMPDLEQEYVPYVGDYLIFDAKEVNRVDRWGMENYQRLYSYEIIKTNSGYNGIKVSKNNNSTNYDIWRFELDKNKLQVCFYMVDHYDCQNYSRTSETFELRSGKHHVPKAKIVVTTCVNADCQDEDLNQGIIIRDTYDLISSVGGPSFQNQAGINCGTQFWGGLVKPDEMAIESYLAGMRILCKKDVITDPWAQYEEIFKPKPFFLSTSLPSEFATQYKGNTLSVRVSIKSIN